MDYLNKDRGGQAAVEMAFDAQVKAFEGLAEELKKPQPPMEISVELAALPQEQWQQLLKP